MEVNNIKLVKDEMCFGNKPISMKIANKIEHSICKIKIKNIKGTGFFMKMSETLKFSYNKLPYNKSQFNERRY